ncbi:LysM peptidoglycan-binding domain-containing protein [Candidatus Woesearchaeota archaeon]|nr:LysM peptidoglycan-binding domain-containing protein [Candidatus Woesearchaeota archaeon]
MPEGNCIEPEERKTVVVEDGDTLWGIAQRTLGAGEDIGERVTRLKKLNLVSDPTLLQIGQVLITDNAGLVPTLYLPETVNLEEGQHLKLRIGFDGLLCGTELQPVIPLPYGASFDPATRVLQWTPRMLQGGRYLVSFRAADKGIGTDIHSYRYSVSQAFTGAFELRVRVEPYQLVTDGEPIEYKIFPSGVGFTPVLTLNGKEGHVIDMTHYIYRTQIQNTSLEELSRYPPTSDEELFRHLQRKNSGRDLSPELLIVLDHTRRVIVAQYGTPLLAPFTFPDTYLNPFPIIKSERMVNLVD